ncbi:MAG: UDP-N-acetylmuramoyl-tripeptide--D-alanyl-D-alanine ligase [Candidatus Paceibacterota bacterium]
MKSFFKKILIAILQWEARAVLKRYNPKIVAITGSVGKTSTKDAVASVLGAAYRVRKSRKSYNSELGVPLTILDRPSGWSNPLSWLGTLIKGACMIVVPFSYPEWLVLEVGADRPGDIRSLTQWVKPDIAIVTRLGKTPVHIEAFDSREQLVDEKSQLVRSLKKGGVAILNYDDDEVRDFSRLSRGSVLYYGFHTQAHVSASHVSVVYESRGGIELPAGISVKANTNGSCVPIMLSGVLGRQHIYPVLAAVAAGVSRQLNLIVIAQALAEHTPPPGRMNLLPGIKNTCIIDDTYNSSPVASEEALSALKDLRVANRRIAVLGDMRELGEHSVEAHRSIGRKAADVCDVLFTVGPESREIATGAKAAGMAEEVVVSFDDSRSAGKQLELLLEEGDTVLVKGSQATRCEKVVEEVMAEPMRAGELLVRQEVEWR